MESQALDVSEMVSTLKTDLIDDVLLEDNEDTQEDDNSFTEQNEEAPDDDAVIYCILCDAEIRGKWAYKKHIIKHQWDAQRGQDPTDEVFTPYQDAADDTAVAYDLHCRACPYVSNVPRDLEKHYHNHLVGYKCLLCDFTTLHRTRLTAHYPTHKREKARLQCTICDATLSSSSALKKHIARHSEGTICCDLCVYKTYDKFLLREHMATKHNEVMKTFKCEHCDEEFGTFRKVFQHRQEAHKGFIYKRQVEPKYCDKCDFQTTRIKEMNVHKLMHQGLVEEVGGKFNCRVQNCNDSFKDALKYELHFVRIHDKDNQYGLVTERIHHCPIEGCTFSTVKEAHLKLHTYSHREERKASVKVDKKKRAQANCPICMVKFSDKYKVRAHLDTVHSTEKPFSCGLCCYKTAYKYNMKNHMKKIHQSAANAAHPSDKDEERTMEEECFNQPSASFMDQEFQPEYESTSEYDHEWE